MPFDPTPAQGRALDPSMHLAVTANAGAGKTAVLAGRFVEILLRTDARLTEIVAITFTEQAAAELRRRVHDVLLERERSGGLPPVLRRRLSDARGQLSSAIIGTIHAFCSRILRMYPAEAHVDASFAVVEGPERARLIVESIAESFSAAMEAGEPRFRELLRAIPPQRLERFMLRLFSCREQLYRRPGGEDDGSRTGHDAIASEVLDRAVRCGWPDHARAVASASRGRHAAELLAALDGGAGAADRTLLARLIADADTTLFTRGGEWRAKFLGDVSPADLPGESAGILAEFEDRFGRVLRMAIAEQADGRGEDYRRITATLGRAFADAERRYAAKKEEAGVLDFEDLQIRTVELLEQEEARARLRGEYRFLLLDEFQDTNDLQYAIVRGLAGHTAQERGAGGANLFIVGDPKQSIYGFRNADVGVFYRACAEIDSPVARARNTGRAETLAESFRPLPVIAAFVNAIFSRLLVRGASTHDVGYDPIVVVRGDDGRGGVELLLAPEAGDRNSALRAECAMLGRRLAAIGRERGFGECAVLLRDRTNLPVLERAFEEAGVPYLLAGGVGFFQTQEVYDVLNYLRFLVNPGDDAALGGILRSPFFALSDAELLAVARHRGETFADRVAAAAPQGGAVGRAHALLSAHRVLADRVPVARVLRRIAAETGWLAVAAGLPDGAQRRENFRKLLELARSRAASGTGALSDFVTALDRRARDEEREGQAPTAETGSAVRVMTIHSAKGLEFSVVALPFLDRAPRAEAEPIVDPRFGLGFKPGRRTERSALAAMLRSLSAERRAAEEKRVFYVGCTRARDVLILSGVEGEKRPADTPLGWFLGAAAAAGAAEKDGWLDFGTAALERLRITDGRYDTESLMVRLSVPVRRPEPAAAVPPPGIEPSPSAAQPARALVAPVPAREGGETYTATMLKTYLECPARYYLAYVLGISPLPVAGEAPDPDDDAAGVPAAPGDAGLIGEYTHLVLSRAIPGEEERAVRARVASALTGAGVPADGELGERVAGNVLSFLRWPRGAEILSEPGARVEFQVSALFGDAVVTGKIDRLAADAGRRMTIVDYKTDAVAAKDVRARGESHRFQLELYSLLASRLFGAPSVRASLVFLSAGPAEVSFEFHEHDFRRVEQTVLSAIASIRSGAFPAASTPCDGCPGRWSPCPVRPAG